MNSKDRRKFIRKYKHHVTLHVLDERYYLFDERVDKARLWCKDNFEKDTWMRKVSWDSSTFKFVKESDAVYFALKWL
jgi:hypothetical protein